MICEHLQLLMDVMKKHKVAVSPDFLVKCLDCKSEIDAKVYEAE